VSLRRDVVILACAISAGIHGALAPAHFAEGAGAGAGFVLATILLAALVLDLTLRPTSSFPVAAAAVVFAGLLVGYAAAATTGLPLLHPDSEPVDGLAFVTKGVEAVGLLTARSLRGAPVTRPIPLPLTILVASFAALTTLALSTGHAGAAHS
jgi:hypothetical protein